MNRQYSPEQFRMILEKAISGDSRAFEAIIDLYEPMLIRYASVDGHVDQDLRQSILIKIALNISKFKMF